MFDVGFSEIVLIMVIALIVVGPARLPKLARTIGKWVGKAQAIVSSVRSEVEREIRVDEIKKTIQEQTPIDDFKNLAKELKSVGADVKAAGRALSENVDPTGPASTKSPLASMPTKTPDPATPNVANASTASKPPPATNPPNTS